MRVALLALAAILPACATAESDPVFRADFSNPAMSPSHWTLTLHPDGSGHFHSQRGNPPPQEIQTMEAPDIDRDVELSEQFTGRVFLEAHDHSVRSGDCESHMKVAFQGWKKLTYAGPEGQWSCEFNYSRDKEIQQLGDSLLAVAGTILEGARLEMLLQHDRLGLDREMEFISDASGDGRLVQLCVIRGILERLAEDPEVMERVRKRARMLLSKPDK
jgi:hypothetical protein